MYTLVLEQTMRDLLTFVFKKVETEDDEGHRKIIDTAYHWDKNPTDYLAFVHALANDETITRLHFTFHNYVHYHENPSLRELTIPRRSSDTLYSDCLEKFDSGPFAYILHNRSEIHAGGLFEESHQVSLGGLFDEMYQTTRYGFMWEADGENVFCTKTFSEIVRFIEDNKNRKPSKCIDYDIYPKISTVNSIRVIRVNW